MKKTKLLVGIFPAAILLAVCAALLLFFAFGGGRTALAQNRNDAPAGGSEGLPADQDPVPALNPALLSLLDSNNAVLRQSYFGHCYAEVTLRGNHELTYFAPYLAFRFAPEDDPAAGWRQEGDSDGFYEENPLADGLSIIRIDLCDEIDPQKPALLGQQDSLRQLVQTTEPITYDLLCTMLEQTPELSHRNNVYFDAPFVRGDPAARGAEEERVHRNDQRVSGGEDVAVFLVDDVKLTVSFIRVEEETLAFYITVEKES